MCLLPFGGYALCVIYTYSSNIRGNYTYVMNSSYTDQSSDQPVSLLRTLCSVLVTVVYQRSYRMLD